MRVVAIHKLVLVVTCVCGSYGLRYQNTVRYIDTGVITIRESPNTTNNYAYAHRASIFASSRARFDSLAALNNAFFFTQCLS